MVSGHEAVKTKTAVWILGEYYKGKNPESWEFLFGRNDENFVKVFGLIKMDNFQNNLGRTWSLGQQLEQLKILPWQRDPNQLSLRDQIRSNHIIQSMLSQRLNRFHWGLVESQVDHDS